MLCHVDSSGFLVKKTAGHHSPPKWGEKKRRRKMALVGSFRFSSHRVSKSGVLRLLARWDKGGKTWFLLVRD